MQNSKGVDTGDQQTFMFCIGAQKAGTTWLQSQLENQKDVFLARPKELHYWDCIRSPYFEQFKLRARKRLHVPAEGDPLRYRMSKFWRPDLKKRIALADCYAAIYTSAPYDHTAYLSYAGVGRKGARLVGDVTPSYALLDRETYAEMLTCAPDVRFVFIMRDPVARLWSGLKQQYRSQIKKGGLTEEALIRRFEAVCRTPLDKNFLRSDYQRTILELEAVVPSTCIHYCFFETLLDPLRGESDRAQLAHFLGIPASYLDAREKVHTTENTFQLPPKNQATARKALDSIYAPLSERFGDQIPETWYI